MFRIGYLIQMRAPTMWRKLRNASQIDQILRRPGSALFFRRSTRRDGTLGTSVSHSPLVLCLRDEITDLPCRACTCWTASLRSSCFSQPLGFVLFLKDEITGLHRDKWMTCFLFSETDETHDGRFSPFKKLRQPNGFLTQPQRTGVPWSVPTVLNIVKLRANCQECV